MKKKQINVQLTQDDLKELLGVVRNLVLEEFANQSRRLFLNSSENAKEIAEIKAREEKNAVIISKNLTKLGRQLSCGVKRGHYFTVVGIYHDATCFHCVKCDLDYQKSNCDLNEREKELLRTVLGGKNENSEIDG